MRYEDFFAYARERYQIFLRRSSGQPSPWTKDAVLRQYRFCNVFREDDVVTQWIREHVNHTICQERLLGSLVIARWFNRVPTLAALVPVQPDLYDSNENIFQTWNMDELRRRLHGMKPLVTGAYMIKTPAGLSKLEGLIECIENVLEDAEHLQARIEPGDTTLEGVTEVLSEYPYLGPFMAYEVVTDLRHTPLLCDAPDIMTWANPGPGCARGLARVVEEPLGFYNRNCASDVSDMLDEMRALLVASTWPELWPSDWPQWEMRDVEHTLCEFDKYERARLGEGKPKQRFNGG